MEVLGVKRLTFSTGHPLRSLLRSGSKKIRPDLSPDEQRVLEHGHIRLLIGPEDIARCDQAIIEDHYHHNVTLVGEHLRYAVVYKEQWLAVATWSSAAFPIKDRDQFIRADTMHRLTAKLTLVETGVSTHYHRRPRKHRPEEPEKPL